MKNQKNNNLSQLDWNSIKNEIKKYASSLSAKEQLENLKPLQTIKEAEDSFHKIDAYQFLLSINERPTMQSLDFSTIWLKKLEKEVVLTPQELKDIRLLCIDTSILNEVITNECDQSLLNLKSELFNTEQVYSAIENIITSNGEIRNDASPLLLSLFNEKNNLTNDVDKKLDKLTKQHNVETVLQERYVTNREGRRVVPVKSSRQSSIPGIVHDGSHSKQTVYIEPELVVPMNNRLRQIDIDIKNEIDRIFKEITIFLAKFHNDFLITASLLLEADVFFAKANFSRSIKAQPCCFSLDIIELISLKHPILVLQNLKDSNINKQEIIENTVYLNNNEQNSDERKNTLILSGPNAGGKTILLKSIGLAAQMARCGLFICSEKGSKIPFFTKINLSIGDYQEVNENLSSFAAHIKTLNSSLKLKGTKNLILIDEICNSTDPEEGGALAQSFIEQYSLNNVFSIITSHLGSLKKPWPVESKITSGSLDYDVETGKPTYLFIPGASGTSQAILAAKHWGTPESILTRSYQLLSKDTKKVFKEQSQITELKEQLQEKINESKKQIEFFKRKKQKLTLLMDKLHNNKVEILDKIKLNANKKIDSLIANKNVTNIFQKNELNAKINNHFPKVIKKASFSKENNNSDKDSPTTIENFSKVFPTGAKVYVPKLNQEGIVQSKPNQKNKVTVQFPSMRLQIMWNELFHPYFGKKSNNNSRKSFSFNTKNSFSSTKDSLDKIALDSTVDYRGFRVNEALESLEILLDKSVQQENDRLQIIHGHGSDALKKAIRAYLSRSIYVEKWASGVDHSNNSNGGDGITWVNLSIK